MCVSPVFPADLRVHEAIANVRTLKSLCIVHTEASLGWGGQEIRIFREMEAMRARGHRLHLAAQAGSQIRQKAEAAGFPVFLISEKAHRFPDSIGRLALGLREIGAEVVNTHSSKDGWIGGLAARLAGVPCLIRSRHIDVDYASARRARLAFGKLPHHVMTTSEAIRSKLVNEVGIPASLVTCVPTGIDPEIFQPGRRAVLREGGLAPADAPLIGMISVIRSWKGHRYFIEAAARMASSHPQVRFVIAGDGPGLGGLPDLVAAAGVKDRFLILGHREDVPELLASLDGLVLPSTAHEGVPQIILQAQLCGCPVIGTRVGGIPEVVEDGVTGRLVPPADAASLAQAMVRLLEDRAASGRMAGEARVRALRDHTVEAMCRRLETIYGRILG
jgi:glycosyltransferase involved in cell wall biosynthesis